jgi:penicillin-binding protein 1A
MMQGVMKFGTGKRAASYGINVTNVAGKTGTTNDNSDAWFMGYTPQLLCGVWTGCDDRFIRFSSTAVGQGSSVALPIWAYFFGNCVKDKTIGLDTRMAFVKPDGFVTDSLPDWTKMPLTGNGEAGDQSSGKNANPSDYDVVPQAPPATPPAPGKKDSVPKAGTLPKSDY